MKIILKIAPIFFVVFFLAFPLSNIYAHSDESSNNKFKKERFAFGPKIAVNISNEWCSPYKSKFLPGADLGLFLRISPSRFYIQPEVHYVLRNTEGGWNNFFSDIAKYKTHHIDVPIMIGFKAIDCKSFKFRIFVGPEFCFKLKNEKLQKHFQLGFQAGLGFDIWRFAIDAGYSFLGNLTPPERRSTHSNIFKIGIGFKCF
jgi:hypothetical protein